MLIGLFFTSMMFAQTSAYSRVNSSYDVGGFESIDYAGSVQKELQRRYTRNKNRFDDTVVDMLENIKYSYDYEVLYYTINVLQKLESSGKIEVDFTSDSDTSSMIKELRMFVRDISRKEQERINAEKRTSNY